MEQKQNSEVRNENPIEMNVACSIEVACRNDINVFIRKIHAEREDLIQLSNDDSNDHYNDQTSQMGSNQFRLLQQAASAKLQSVDAEHSGIGRVTPIKWKNYYYQPRNLMNEFPSTSKRSADMHVRRVSTSTQSPLQLTGNTDLSEFRRLFEERDSIGNRHSGKHYGMQRGMMQRREPDREVDRKRYKQDEWAAAGNRPPDVHIMRIEPQHYGRRGSPVYRPRNLAREFAAMEAEERDNIDVRNDELADLREEYDTLTRELLKISYSGKRPEPFDMFKLIQLSLELNFDITEYMRNKYMIRKVR